MRTLFLLLFLFFLWDIQAQKPFIRDYSLGYRIGEGNAYGGTHFQIPPLLKKPAAFQQFFNALEWNSMYGNPAPVTYHWIFAQAELNFMQNRSRLLRNISIPIGINYAFRQKVDGMGIGNSKWYNRPNSLQREEKMYWLAQYIRFAGIHTGIHRKVRLGKKVSLTTGILLQGTIAINHRFHQKVDTLAYSTTAHAFLYKRTDPLETLQGRNFTQWSMLFPLAAEINVYKKRYWIKPEITVGILSDRYLAAARMSRESINAGLWFIYRKP